MVSYEFGYIQHNSSAVKSEPASPPEEKDSQASTTFSLQEAMNVSLPEESNPSPKKKAGSSSGNLRLTPSEIESLRTHKKQVSAQAHGKFKHLFQD
ncbi:MAG TPA: hypothetical protein DEQ20_00575 [Desulfobulbaceae bacterium]|nr:MAG: hypothetical protein A2520_02185 [Deltaproteobacteria bacterium RIFOXYD12_FULL_53_23]HCC53413.1 hypothetical protein [Desulfobulbaceae bacterium]